MTDEDTLREELVRTLRQLSTLGLNRGTSGSAELAAAVVDTLQGGNACLMANHGQIVADGRGPATLPQLWSRRS
jgi:ribulose-5-phosphate 4-epimerase/fuculose-1-phosphate aldolase